MPTPGPPTGPAAVRGGSAHQRPAPLVPLLALTLAAGCATMAGQVGGRAAGRPAAAPAGARRAEAAPLAAGAARSYRASGPTVARATELPPRPPSLLRPPGPPGDGRREMPIPEAEAERLRARALLARPTAAARPPLAAGAAPPSLLGGFDGLDFTAGGHVPPDPELAVGLAHLVAVVNETVAVYDPGGQTLVGPVALDEFVGCTGTFDPNAVYDEAADRFVVGADSGGVAYCLAVSVTGDPTGAWYRYRFPTSVGGAFFDYPHIGVGRDALYLGANLFGPTSGHVWAIDKAAAYAGTAPAVVSRSIGQEWTPQPAHLHGFHDRTWPSSGPHYLVTDAYDGAHHTVWAWRDPFAGGDLQAVGTIDLNAATGVTAEFPVDARQAGSNRRLTANDWSGLDCEYRNGALWLAQDIGCNPGNGTVDCVRWAEIDPAVPRVVQAGVLGSDGDYRLYPDLAVNRCNGMMVGYTSTSRAIFPAVAVASREAGDPPGTLTAELVVRDGEVPYDAYDGSPFRWGDYSEMTIAPDGRTFWYVGEFSKDLPGADARWGTHVATLTLPCPACGNGLVDAGEACDAAGVDGADCDFDCTPAVCGDGHPNAAAGEGCDDGNTAAGDGCDGDCQVEPPCSPASLGRPGVLAAVEDGRGGALFAWGGDPYPDLVEYHLNSVPVKTELTDPRLAPTGFAAGQCRAAAPATTCTDPDAIGDGRLLFYQVLSACGEGGAREGPF